MKRFGIGGASTTEPGQRMARTYSELQTWKRQLVKADSQLRNFEASTQQLTAMLDVTLHAYPRVWQHTSLGNNDGHLPQEVATLPAPTTPPATLMSAETMKELTARLKTQTHAPLDAWHIRYGELKVAMVPLEASRKHYEQACGDLIKAQAYQQKVAGKKGPDAAAALDGGITEKEALRQERWGKYLELEEQTYQKAVRLAADARGAQDFFSAAMGSLAGALGALGHQYASLNGGGAQAPGGGRMPAAPASGRGLSPEHDGWAKTSAGHGSPAATSATSSPASSAHGGAFPAARTYAAAGPALPGGAAGQPGRPAAEQEREWMRMQQQEEQAAAVAAGGPGGAKAGRPVAAGPAIAAVDLPLHKLHMQDATSPGAASSTPGSVSPEHQAWQPPMPAAHRYREQSRSESPSPGQQPPPPVPQEQQQQQQPPQQRAQHRYGDFNPGGPAPQDWSPPRHGPSHSSDQGDLPMGANMLRTDSAPSPDGPPNTGYTRPAKLPARLPVRDSSYKASSGPGLPRAAANGNHSRRATENSEASVVAHPISPPDATAGHSEAEASQRYPPQ